VRFVGGLGDFAPSVIDLGDQFLLESFGVLLLFDEVADHEEDLFGPFGAEEFEVEFEDDFEYFELSSFEGADLLYPDVDEQRVRDREGEQRVSPLYFLRSPTGTVLSSRSLESLPSTSKITMFDADSTLNQMPFVVCPTRCRRFSTSKSVPKSALRSVLLPELWEPMMERIWYFLWSSRLVSLARVSSSSILRGRGGT
jgi:hypothetical protein